MLKLRLSHFEKVTGLFVFFGLALALASWLGAALKQGWFESRISYYSKFQSGEGLYSGLDVLLSGIRVGSVTRVELLDTNEVHVEFHIIEKYQDKIRQDSRVLLIRPLVLGEKALEITLGDRNLPVLLPGQEILSRPTFDVMSLLSGRIGSDHFLNLAETLHNLASVFSVLLEKQKLEGFVKTIDRIDPLIRNLDGMSKEVIILSKQLNKNEKLGHLVQDITFLTNEVQKIIPEVKSRAPAMANHFELLVQNMALLSDQFKVIGPAIAEVGPELPGATRKALEALNETVLLLKAFQKSFLLKGHIEDIKNEEQKKQQEEQSLRRDSNREETKP
jgi:phospholipid/cholesterol/gamma-HCH transport system substrate-binding protein